MSEDWKEVDGKLRAMFEFPDFAAAMVFVNKEPAAAEKANHHPDILIHYNKVGMELWTHSEGKVTDKDRQLAEKISQLFTVGRRG